VEADEGFAEEELIVNQQPLVRMGQAGIWLMLALTGTADDWPQWRGPTRDGVWHESGILESFPPSGLEFSWRVPVGRGWSSPVVAGGRVYLTDVEIAQGTATERVLCFDAATGKLLWSHRYAAHYPDWALDPASGGPRSTQIIHGGRIFTLGAMGQLLCLDCIHGKVVWEKNLAKEYDMKEFTGITASPVIEGNLLILYICGKPEACVIALDRNSGKEAWRALDDSFTYSSPIIVRAGGAKQLIVWTQEAVTSLDPATGRTWWREVQRTSGDQAVSTPVFNGHNLLVAGLMFKLDEHKPAASVLWPETKAAMKRILSNTSTALVRDGYVFSGTYSGDLVCLEAGSGKEVWRTNSVTAPGNGSSIHLSPNGDAVFLFTDQGNLIRAELSARGYREYGRARVLEATSPFGQRKCAWVPPAFANRHLFARNDNELVCASLAAKR